LHNNMAGYHKMVVFATRVSLNGKKTCISFELEILEEINSSNLYIVFLLSCRTNTLTSVRVIYRVSILKFC